MQVEKTVGITAPRALETAFKNAKNVRDELQENASFNEAAEALLEVAASIAHHNKRLLVRAETGAEVEHLEGNDKKHLEGLINIGVGIAQRLMQVVGREASHEDDRSGQQSYHVFLSHSGKDKDDYVHRLYTKLRNLKLDVFLDKISLEGSSSPTNDMFKRVIAAKMVISVCTFHCIQYKWPIAELLCGLARNVERRNPSPLLVDLYPGRTWLESEVGDKRKPRSWADDTFRLVPGEFPNAKPMHTEVTEGELVLHAVESGVVLRHCCADTTFSDSCCCISQIISTEWFRG